jgi:hypothetical protein
MTRPALLACLLALTACPPPVGEPDDTDSGDTDTDTDAPTQTIAVAFDGAVGQDWRAALFRVAQADPSPGSELVLVGETASTALEAQRVTLALAPPDRAALDPVLGVEGAGWLVAAYDDRDRNEQRGANEATEAIARTLIVWLDTEVQVGAATVPAQTFVALQITPGSPPTIGDVAADVPLRALPYRTSVAGNGSIPIELLSGVDRMASYLARTEGDPLYENAPYDQPFLSQSFNVSIGSPLHPSRQIRFDPSRPLPLTVERPVAYDDVDGDTRLGAADTIRAWGCRDGRPFAFGWIPQVLDPVQAQLVDELGLGRGWAPVIVPGDGPPEPVEAPATNLSFAATPGCDAD